VFKFDGEAESANAGVSFFMLSREMFNSLFRLFEHPEHDSDTMEIDAASSVRP